jgi:hypothetical protein
VQTTQRDGKWGNADPFSSKDRTCARVARRQGDNILRDVRHTLHGGELQLVAQCDFLFGLKPVGIRGSWTVPAREGE